MYIYFNVYLIKKVYFGYGIVEITAQQEQILKNIYKEIILHKLGYSVKFPRRVLYIRRNTLGIGLIRLKTVIETLALKLYIRQRHTSTKIA